MLISGTIQSVSPPDFQDKYNNHYQNITIQTVTGLVIGRIGTKQPYTNQNIGQQGQWDSEQVQGGQGPYNKFKKHYDRPYQTPQGPSQAAGGSQPSKNVDWDAKDLRQARMNGLNNATRLICLLVEMTKNDTSLNIVHVKGVAAEYVDYIYNGLPKKGPNAATPNPAMSGEDYGPPPTEADVPTGENIPF